LLQDTAKEGVKVGYGRRFVYADVETSDKLREDLVRQNGLEEVDDGVGMTENDSVVQPPH
jgi:hypothetical protein